MKRLMTWCLILGALLVATPASFAAPTTSKSAPTTLADDKSTTDTKGKHGKKGKKGHHAAPTPAPTATPAK